MRTQGQNRINVVKHRNLFFGISLALIIPGLIFWGMGGLKPGIDFTGGSMIQYNIPQGAVNSQDIRAAVQGTGIKDPQVQLAEGTAGGTDVFVRTRELNDAQRDAALKAVQAKYPKIRQESFGSVGSTISQELIRNAFETVLLASLLITLFLAYQFKSAGFVTGLKYGFAAVIALGHDVLVLIGIFAICGYFLNWEIDSLFVTAVLTVIGFSVHDTIIVFDRIRENWRNRTKESSFTDVVNASVNQTLSRSINTSLTVIITLLALFFFGGSVLKLFIAALLFGIISGTYSSIFNASPLLWLMERASATEKAAAPTAAPARRTPTPAPTVAPTNRPTVTPRPSTPPRPSDEADVTTESPATPSANRPTARTSAERARVQTKRKKRF
jgi:preprotein translocase SecF subunit